MVTKPRDEELKRNIRELQTEVTQWKERAETLQRQHEFVDAVLSVADSLVVVLGPDGKIVRFNKACEVLSGYVFEEVKDEPFWNRLLVAEEVESVKAVFSKLSSGQFPIRHENYWQTKDGDRRLISWSNTALLDDNGSVAHVIGTGIDITERKLAEVELLKAYDDLERRVEESTAELRQANAELKESEELFRAFMDNNPAHIYMKDEGDRHIYGNRSVLEDMGKTREEFIGSTTFEFFPAEAAEELIEIDRRVLRGDIIRTIKEWNYPKNGRIRWYRDIKFPIQIREERKLLGGIAVDITEEKQKAEDLKNAYEEIKSLKERFEQENIYLREEIQLQHKHEEIIGKSRPITEMLSRSEQVAKTDSTVLILGETGTGKELLARAIHRLSPRRGRQLVTVNCAALPATLIEAELFGREKGAYTGAMTSQIGRFEIANGSTIFLDEIGELPLEGQAKLLRVLEEGKFERLGSPKTSRVDVRVIASTNRDLSAAVEQGGFREDLYHRLNVFSITVPPLRDRREDIPLLVWAFSREYERTMGKRVEKIKTDAMARLSHYDWPGNVRELRNVIERAMILTQGSTLRVELREGGQTSKASSNWRLEDVEREHILAVLGETGWRVSGSSGAAQILGLKPTTLEARMKKLGIKRPA